MTKLEGNLTPNVRFNAKGDNSLLVFRWGSQVVPTAPGRDGGNQKLRLLLLPVAEAAGEALEQEHSPRS